ncbi:MAG: MFS transporter [Thermoplasmata archaeon]|nr:MFS transporter [Thermoplasmata archaeon]
MGPMVPGELLPPTALQPGRPTWTRDLGYFLGGNTASWAGLGLADVLLVWLVFSATGSTLAVAAVGLAQTVPPIAAGYFGGALADRYNRRRLLVVTAVAQAVILGLVPLTLRLLGFQLGIVLALALAFETATVIFGLVTTVFLPGMVPSGGIEGANAVTQAFSSVSWAAGAAVAAGLLATLGTSESFALDFLVFAVGAILVALIAGRPAARPAPPPAARSFRDDFVDGLRFLRGHAWLLRFTAVAVAAGFFVTMFSPYLVVFTVQALGLPASFFGYLAGGYSAGFLVGSLLTGRFRLLEHFGLVLGLSLVGSGGLLGLLVVAPNLPFALVAFALMGILMGIVLTGSITLVQRVVPSELLGRYLGLQETVVWVVAPVGVVTGGLLIAAYGARSGFALAALGLAVVGLVTVASPSLRSIGSGPSSGGNGGLPAPEHRGSAR